MATSRRGEQVFQLKARHLRQLRHDFPSTGFLIFAHKRVPAEVLPKRVQGVLPRD